MAVALESDYWCVFNDCSQGGRDDLSSLFTAESLDSSASDTTITARMLPSLFDELDDDAAADQELFYGQWSLGETQDSDDRWPMVNPREISNQLPDELLNLDSIVEDEEETVAVSEEDFVQQVDDGYSESVSDRSSTSDCPYIVPETSLPSTPDIQEMTTPEPEPTRVFPQRMAARRAEIVVAKMEDSNDDDDDDDYDEEYQEKRKPRKAGMASHQQHHKLTSVNNTVSRRTVCRELNRNALNAKLNREKKKAYMAELERRESQLGNENTRLKYAVGKLAAERNKLQDEVKYLRSVLANDSALADLVGAIRGGVRLSSKFSTGVKRSRVEDAVETDHDYAPARKSTRRATEEDESESPAASAGSGICLHVREDFLSLEFCEKCSKMSRGSNCAD